MPVVLGYEVVVPWMPCMGARHLDLCSVSSHRDGAIFWDARYEQMAGKRLLCLRHCLRHPWVSLG